MSNEEATDQPKWGTICTLTCLELPWDGIVMEVKTIPKWNKLDNWRQKTILTNPNPFMTSLESPVEFYGFLLLRSTWVRVIFLTLSLKWRYWWEFSWRSHERLSHLNITPKCYYGLNLRYLQYFHVFRHLVPTWKEMIPPLGLWPSYRIGSPEGKEELEGDAWFWCQPKLCAFWFTKTREDAASYLCTKDQTKPAAIFPLQWWVV